MPGSYKHIIMAGVLLLTGSTHSPLFAEGKSKEKNNGCVNYIVITGESNVNRFSFSYTTLSSDFGNAFLYPSLPHGNEINIPVRDFEPSNPLMYKDFLANMHEHDYPTITIKFSDLGQNIGMIPVLNAVYTVMITIAGVTREYNVECAIQNCGNHYLLRGSKAVRLTDFNLAPPEKLSGLVKVKDEFKVSFGIILNFTADNSLTSKK
jgi:hypothetical protein